MFLAKVHGNVVFLCKKNKELNGQKTPARQGKIDLDGFLYG
jgi:hypothetical protein